MLTTMSEYSVIAFLTPETIENLLTALLRTGAKHWIRQPVEA